jgi:hypothetical protein
MKNMSTMNTDDHPKNLHSQNRPTSASALGMGMAPLSGSALTPLLAKTPVQKEFCQIQERRTEVEPATFGFKIAVLVLRSSLVNR